MLFMKVKIFLVKLWLNYQYKKNDKVDLGHQININKATMTFNFSYDV